MKQKRIFISHNSQWQHIDDFADLIRELGYYPVVVEKEPARGKDPKEKSKHYLDSSDMVIFVITKDAVEPSGKPHPKSNVAMEIGLADGKFEPEKSIFFLEDGAETPSMVTETYTRVRYGNYYRAIAELVRNIRSVLPHPQYEESPAVELSEVEKFIVLELARRWLPRRLLRGLLDKKFSIDERKSNILIAQLKGKAVIREGEIAVGQEHSGDMYLELTGLGWELAAKSTEHTEI